MAEVTEKARTGVSDLQAALARRRAEEAAAPAAAEPAAPVEPEPEEAAPAKKAPTKKAAAKKSAAKRPAAKSTPKAAAARPAEPEPEEEDEAQGDPLAGLRRSEQPMKVQLGQRISPDTAHRFRRFCAINDFNQGEFLDLAIREALERYGAE